MNSFKLQWRLLMIPAKSEFVADLLLSVMETEPELKLYFGILFSSFSVKEAKEEVGKVFTKEITDSGYARQPVVFTKPKNGLVGLVNDIKFPKMNQRWRNVTHYAIFDDCKDGNMLLLKPIGMIVTIEPGEIAGILANEYTLYVGYNHTTINEMK